VEPLKKISLTENQMLQNPLAAKQANAFYRRISGKFETIVGEKGLNSLEVKDSVSPEGYSKSKYIDSEATSSLDSESEISSGSFRDFDARNKVSLLPINHSCRSNISS
jgi:hypothetical protein